MKAPRRYGTATAKFSGGSYRSSATKSAATSGAKGRGQEAEAAEASANQGETKGASEADERRYGTTNDPEREPLLLSARSSDDQGARNAHGKRGRSRWALYHSIGSVRAFAPGSSRRDNGKILTTLLTLNYMIGSGILNSAQVVEQSGVASATILYIISALTIWFGLVVLIMAAEEAYPRNATGSDRTEVSPDGGGRQRLVDLDFARLADDTIGSLGATSVNASVVIGNFGDVCSYVLLVGSLTGSLLEEWFGDESVTDDYSGDDAWWSSFWFVTPIMVLLFVLPPCFIRHFSNLRFLSAYCIIAITAVVCLVVFGGPIYASDYRSRPQHDPGLDAPVKYWDWIGSIAKLGSIVFALSSSVAALHGYTGMRPRTESAWRVVAGSAIVIGLVLCYSTGLMGYLSFRNATEANILDNFDGGLASAFKFLVVFHLILYIPTEVVILRHSLFTLCGRDVMEESFAPVAWVTFGVLMGIVALMVGLELAGVAQGDLFGYILDLTGGLAGSFTSFILPALVYLAATREEAITSRGYGNGRSRYCYYRAACRGLIYFGVLVMVFVPVGVVLDIMGY